MPELHYLYNPPYRPFAQQAQNLGMQLPHLRLQAERLRQQQAIAQAHEILYGYQAREAQARTGLYEAQATAARDKSSQGRSIAEAIQASGRARAAIQNMQMNPAQLGALSP